MPYKNVPAPNTQSTDTLIKSNNGAPKWICDIDQPGKYKWLISVWKLSPLVKWEEWENAFFKRMHDCKWIHLRIQAAHFISRLLSVYSGIWYIVVIPLSNLYQCQCEELLSVTLLHFLEPFTVWRGHIWRCYGIPDMKTVEAFLHLAIQLPKAIFSSNYPSE